MLAEPSACSQSILIFLKQTYILLKSILGTDKYKHSFMKFDSKVSIRTSNSQKLMRHICGTNTNLCEYKYDPHKDLLEGKCKRLKLQIGFSSYQNDSSSKAAVRLVLSSVLASGLL